MWDLNIDELVEDNVSPHNNQTIRDGHRANGIRIVGYEATDAEKDKICALIREQCVHYKREQDRKAQMTKQTHELDRLPAWTPNSPDLNLSLRLCGPGWSGGFVTVMVAGRRNRRPLSRRYYRRGTQSHWNRSASFYARIGTVSWWSIRSMETDTLSLLERLSWGWFGVGVVELYVLVYIYIFPYWD